MLKHISLITFLIPITILFVGINRDNLTIVSSGFSLLLYFYAAHLGSSIGELKKGEKISVRKIGLFISLFLVSVIVLITCVYFDKVVLGSIISCLLGILAIILLFKRSKRNTE